MGMRGNARRAESSIAIDPRSFGWDRAVAATLRHSTLPWLEPLDAMPLDVLQEIGKRDRLSLTGQFAAHQAFLQFAGVRDCDFDPKQWMVVRKRGTDCRLVRVQGAPPCDPVPSLTSIQQFAHAVSAEPLEVFRRSWARADTAYQEVEARLRTDAAADLRWLRASASGCVASPGIEGLRTLLTERTGRFRCPDDLCLQSLKLCGDPVAVIGETASPLDRYSAIASLQ